MRTSRQLRFAARSVGSGNGPDWDVVETDARDPADGEFLVEITHVALEPMTRRWTEVRRSLGPAVETGNVLRATGLGRVIASHHRGYDTGDLVSGTFGVQEHAVSDGIGVRKIPVREGISMAAHLGVLGTPGMTAYFGLLEVAGVEKGETVLISGAAGGIGVTVGQIAKLQGARVVGTAPDSENCRVLVDELGFDAAIHAGADDLDEQLDALAPDGVDVCFDTAGGEILEHGVRRLRRGARLVICGAVPHDEASESITGPTDHMLLLVSDARRAGFGVFDFAYRFSEAIDQLSQWLLEGTLTSCDRVVRGDITTIPDALRHLSGRQATRTVVFALGPEA